MDYRVSNKPIEPKKYNFKKKIIPALAILGTYITMASNYTFFFTLDRLIKDHSREEINMEMDSENSALKTFAKYSMFISGKPGRDLAYYLFDKGDKN